MTHDHTGPPTDDQLHAKACIGVDCPATSELISAGHVYTETSASTAPLGWAVVACPDHAPEEKS